MDKKELKEALTRTLVTRTGYVAIVRVFEERNGERVEVINPKKPYLCRWGNNGMARVNAEHIYRELEFFRTVAECEEAVVKYIARLNRLGNGKDLTKDDVLVEVVRVRFTIGLEVK